ncbi:MAG: TRAP transporter small permease [Desulfobacteraceae bacterium]|nr:MAG: TRAP transporter small permease [Desulfobacteraceae bacterium]
MGSDKRSNPAAPGSGRRRGSFFVNLVALMNSLGTGWIFVLLLLINADIISRTVFNSPVRGVTEIVGMTIVGCVFLQLAHALKVGRLTRSDIILARLERNRPQIRRALEAAYNLVGGFVLAILVVYSIPLFREAWTINEYEGAEGDFTAPVWPVKLIIVIGSLVAALQCLANCYRIIREMQADNSAARGGPS